MRNLRRVHREDGHVDYPVTEAFEALTPFQRFDFSEGGGVHILTIQRDTLGNGEWPEDEYRTPMRVDPAPMALLPDSVAQIMARLGDQLRDAYLLFVLLVYRNGGYILYKYFQHDMFFIYIIFLTHPPQDHN